MKCNPWRWLWGLPLLAMLVWITLLLEQDRIQADLRERSVAALSEKGLGWAFAAYSGRDATLTGRAYSEDGPQQALSIVRGVWGVRVAEAEIGLIDRVAQYIWTASFESGVLRLSGYVPDEQNRANVISLARKAIPQAEIDDQMQLGRGAPDPEPWKNGIEFGLKQLAALSNGSVDMNGLGLSIAGEALTQGTFKSVKRALRSDLPKGVKLVSDKVLPPVADPFVWTAQRSARQVVMSGYVPSEQVRKELFDHAKTLFPNLAIIDRMETARGAPEGWDQVARTSLAQLAKLQSGEASINAQNFTLSGEAVDKASADSIEKRLGVTMPLGYDVDVDLSFPEPKPPVVTPYTTSIDVTEETVRLTGYVPDAEARTRVFDAVTSRFKDRRVVNNLELASGQPETWETCLQAGLFGLERLGSGSLTMVDAGLKVSGATSDEQLAEALPAEVRAKANRACSANVNVALDLPPEPNLTWRATHRGEGEVVLEGDVPDAETRAALVAEAGRLFPGARIIDRMTVVSGYSKKWRTVALDGLRMLTKLRSGEAVVSNQELLLRGEAKDTAVAAALKDQLKHNIAKGYVGRNIIEVRSDAMIWAELEAKRKQKEQAEAAAQAARQAEVDAEARRRAENAARVKAAAQERLRREEDAQREAREKAIFERELEERRRELLARRAADQEKSQRLDRLKALQNRKSADRRAKADACQDLLRSTAREGAILFDFASARLDPSSSETLDRLVEVANACPSFRIEIEGHTDAEGPPAANKVLSERRAQAVVTYLSRAGVTARRLSAVGYGETRPVAPNDTPQNRAKNRRIEFAVKVE